MVASAVLLLPSLLNGIVPAIALTALLLAKLSGRNGHLHERRAVAFQACEVLIARLLMDAGLLTELGLHRKHAQAVGHLSAVSAAFADALVDDHSEGRSLNLAAAALLAQVGGAFLVVDEGRGAFDLTKLPLHIHHIGAGAKLHIGRPVGFGRVFLNVVGHHYRAAHSLCRQQHREVGHGSLACGRLSARHGHHAVVENLEGDVHARSHSLADGERARMV